MLTNRLFWTLTGALTIIAVPITEAAKIYRCMENGQLAFQDTPCASTTRAISSASTQAREAKRNELQLRLREMMREKRLLILEEQQARESAAMARRQRENTRLSAGVEEALRARYLQRFDDLQQAMDQVETRIDRLQDD